MRRPPAAVLTTVLATAALTVLAGCGDDGGSEPDAAGTPVVGPPAGSTDEVVAEVSQVAPALESAYRGGDYPQSVDDVEAGLADAGVTLAPGLSVGGYAYDTDAVEFVLCLEDEAGAWASYDTAPMGVRDAGDAGGCPPA